MAWLDLVKSAFCEKSVDRNHIVLEFAKLSHDMFFPQLSQRFRTCR